MARPKVVIVGAGPAGLAAAKALKGKADVTIIEAKGWHEINWATPRVLTDPEFAKSVVHPYNAIPDIGTFIAARVTGVTDAAVLLDDGASSVPYEFLILAPGSTYPEPAIKGFSGSLGDRKATIQAEYKRLQAASSVAIIGGGPVGVEVAGEILTDLPGKQVTIITSAQQLLAGKSAKVGASAANWITSHGGKVVLGQKAVRQTNGKWLLTDGTPLEADVVYQTVGGSPNTEFLKGLDILDKKGAIKVTDKLQVQGRSNVFAIGDATDIKEVKLGYFAGQHAELVAKNIQAMLAGKPLKAWKPNGGMSIMFVSLGRGFGTGHIGPVTLTGCLSFLPKMKAKDLFAGKTKGMLGIK